VMGGTMHVTTLVLTTAATELFRVTPELLRNSQIGLPATRQHQWSRVSDFVGRTPPSAAGTRR
jgi:hypothetical protein